MRSSLLVASVTPIRSPALDRQMLDPGLDSLQQTEDAG
jgi:hypothetical protein